MCRRLSAIARRLGATPAQLAIAFCLTNPDVSTVILGPKTVEQLYENLGALDVLPKIDDAVMAEIELVLENKPVTPKDFVQAELDKL